MPSHDWATFAEFVPEPDGYPAFQRVASELAGRIGFLMHHIALHPITPGPIVEES